MEGGLWPGNLDSAKEISGPLQVGDPLHSQLIACLWIDLVESGKRRGEGSVSACHRDGPLLVLRKPPQPHDRAGVELSLLGDSRR